MRLPKVSLTTKIFIGLIAGVVLGYFKPDWGTAVRPLSILFLNLLKSVIAPLIFSTLVIGIAGTAFNLEEEQPMALHAKLQVGRYTLINQSTTQDDTPRYESEAALLDVYKDGQYMTQLAPELRTYKPNDQPDHIVANHSTLQEDLYVVYEGRDSEGSPVIKAHVNRLVAWVWIGVWIVILGTGVALVPNAAQIKSPVIVAEVLAAKQFQPAGVGK